MAFIADCFYAKEVEKNFVIIIIGIIELIVIIIMSYVAELVDFSI